VSTGSENHREPVQNRWPTGSGNRFREVVYIDHRNRFRGPAQPDADRDTKRCGDNQNQLATRQVARRELAAPDRLEGEDKKDHEHS
jgi:hypothetical protein